VLWGKPDWADRPSEKLEEWLTRPRNKAGTEYKYNDARVGDFVDSGYLERVAVILLSRFVR
jgi:hypothetical protein